MVLYQLDRNIEEENLLNRNKNKKNTVMRQPTLNSMRSQKRAMSEANNQAEKAKNMHYQYNLRNRRNYDHSDDLSEDSNSDTDYYAKLSENRRIVTETRAGRRGHNDQNEELSYEEDQKVSSPRKGKKKNKDKDKKKFKNRIRSMSEKNSIAIGKNKEKGSFLPKIFKEIIVAEEQNEQKPKKLKQKNPFHSNIHLTKTLEKKLLLKEIQKSTQEDNKLGKLVLEKVEKHFDMEKRHNHHHHLYTEGYSHMTINNIEDVEGGQSQQNKINYFQRVKSEEDIDDTLVKYLKNRVKQADLMISHNTENVREHLKKNRSRKN